MNRAQSRRAPLTLEEACAYTNLTERQMRRAVAERRVAFHKTTLGRGGRLLFLVEDLDEMFDVTRVEAR